MDSNQQVESPQKENLPLSNTISLMIMGGIGRVRTLTISRRILMGASLFFICYIIFSIFIISEFFSLRLQHRALSDRFEEIENRYNEMEKDLLQARQRAANFEAYIESIGEQKEESEIIPEEVPQEAGEEVRLASATEQGPEEVQEEARVEDKSISATEQGPEEVPQEAGEEVKSISATEKGPEEVPQEASAEDKLIGVKEKGTEVTLGLVDVEGMTIKELDSGLSVDFRLTNIGSGMDAMEGFVHIMVYDKNNNLPAIWNSSSRYTENGLPSDFTRGLRFIIQRFKQYHREFMADSTLGMPATISILAYDTAGNLIFKRDYDVNDVS